MDSAFLVTTVDMPNAILRRMYRERDMCAVNDTEHHFDAFGLQTPCQQFTNSYFSHEFLLQKILYSPVVE